MEVSTRAPSAPRPACSPRASRALASQRKASRTLGGCRHHQARLARSATQARGSRTRARVATPNSSVDVDTALVKELKENGFRSTRRTKLVCTIGPATSGYEELEQLASNGMNVARLNMCHGSHGWHKSVIERIRKLNQELGYSLAIMVDTEGSEVHIGDIEEPRQVEIKDKWTFTIRSLDRDLPGAPSADQEDGGAALTPAGGEGKPKSRRSATTVFPRTSKSATRSWSTGGW